MSSIVKLKLISYNRTICNINIEIQKINYEKIEAILIIIYNLL